MSVKFSKRGFARAMVVLALGGASLAAAAQQLTVSAAASMTNVMKELGGKYEAAHPGVKLQFNFAASGVLLQQIAQGAPVDVFISADQPTMDKGVAQKLIDPATRRDVAANTVVLVVPGEGAKPIKSASDLTSADVKRVAVGKVATVPAGHYTQQALESAKLWSVLEPKFVYADSVRQVLDYVARGEAEAGFVYATDAAIMKDKVKVVATMTGHSPVTYPMAVVAESKEKAAAKAFTDYLLTAPAQAVLQQAGFAKP